MIDGKSLLDQFLGGGGVGNIGTLAKEKLEQAWPLGSFGAGAATGGLLGLLLGGKKMRKMAGGVAGYGGAAVVGALAYRAFQAWQQGQSSAGAPAAPPAGDARFLPTLPASPDTPSFELAVVRAMIGAAKALVFDALAKPVELDDIAAAAGTPEQRAELYVACRMVIDPGEPADRAYMEALAFRLGMPKDLVGQLEQQVATALPAT